MADTSLMYYNEKLGKTNPRELVLFLNITGAKAVSPRPIGPPILTTFDAIASQSTINNFLGTTDEFTIAQFDGTAMGTDTLGVIINMSGQVGYVLGVTTQCYSGANFATLTTNTSIGTGLTDSSNTSQCAVGADGNMALRTVVSGMDILTTGVIVLRIMWISK
jgi:hypothetical protein